MKKKLNLNELEVQSFVTNMNWGDRKEIGGVDGICGWTLCPPCTQNPVNCFFSISDCPRCITVDDRTTDVR